MRKVKREYTLYKIDELDENARQSAYNEWLNHFDDFDLSDNENTLNAFLEVFYGIEVRSWSYDTCEYDYTMRSRYDEDIECLSGERLLSYLYNNYYDDLFKSKHYYKTFGTVMKTRRSRIFVDNCCVLTGFIRDEDILEPIYRFLEHPNRNTTFLDLMEDCLDSFFSACQKDYEYYSSMEGFESECESNDWEFLEDGRQWI